MRVAPLQRTLPLVRSLAKILVIGIQQPAFHSAMLRTVSLSAPFPFPLVVVRTLKLRIPVSATFALVVRVTKPRSVTVVVIRLAALLVLGGSVLVVPIAVVKILSGTLAWSLSLREALHARFWFRRSPTRSPPLSLST
ncbi:hypothetical protein CIPAW_02G178800 [Carya illinoinensis]|uniref:Transmembrane protein n=1 Tax=Carya illinoinensis TaxID=32201 RepID=A0A8T1RFA3_CARIL|nr:hypothetical protein CIPAW_02G178800 [Carya illinoinensis]